MNIQRSRYLYNIYGESASEFGVIARRTIIKEKPMGRNYVDPNTFDDYSSLSGLFPWEPIAINKYNSDKSWAYITSVDYRGWIPTKDIMKVPKNKLIEFQNQSFVTVISDKSEIVKDIFWIWGRNCHYCKKVEKTTLCLCQYPEMGTGLEILR